MFYMSKHTFELTPRDVLFFRDARPMDVDKDRTDDVFNVGHGANWPRPDQLFSAVIHELIRNPMSPERDWYGMVTDLRVTGPFPVSNGKMFLPIPLDWDMRLEKFDANTGLTDIPEPLEAGFSDRVPAKKSYPRWISMEDYERYLEGKVGTGKRADEVDDPQKDGEVLYTIEARVGNTLDPSTGASKRVESRNESGRYAAEYLRLGNNVRMICDIETEKADSLDGKYVRFGGQGGLVRFSKTDDAVISKLQNMPRGKPSLFVKWTLLTPALFANGWYPNWLERTPEGKLTGKVMLPSNKILRQPGESRAAFRARMNAECGHFESARLIAACVGKALAFSGYDSEGREKPTELAVPAGSSYVFECSDQEEAAKLFDALNLKSASDLGEKGFGLGICSYTTLTTVG